MVTSERNPIGLVIPTALEARDIVKAFGFRPGPHQLLQATIENRLVLLCISGVGAKAAAKASERLVNAGAKELVSVGFCGALVPELRVGDLVTDRIATVDRPVCTPVDRRVLTARANAVAVDMETRAIVETGTRLGVPIQVVRVVSDEFADDLTPLFGRHGSLSMFRLALRLLDPRTWPLARKLKAQSKISRRVLVQAVKTYCER